MLLQKSIHYQGILLGTSLLPLLFVLSIIDKWSSFLLNSRTSFSSKFCASFTLSIHFLLLQKKRERIFVLSELEKRTSFRESINQWRKYLYQSQHCETLPSASQCNQPKKQMPHPHHSDSSFDQTTLSVFHSTERLICFCPHLLLPFQTTVQGRQSFHSL